MNTATSKILQMCCIRACPSWLRNHDEIRFFSFPNEDKMLLDKWLMQCRDALIIKPEDNALICSLHFFPKEIDAHGLCAGAFPTLNLDIFKVEFLEKIVRLWISQNQYHQSISRKTCCDIVTEARDLLQIPSRGRGVSFPDWISNFKYQPILADPKGLLRVSKPLGVADIINKLTDVEQQEQTSRLVSVVGEIPIKNMSLTDDDDQRHYRKRRKIDNLYDSRDGILNKSSTNAESIHETCVEISDCEKFEVLDARGQPKVVVLGNVADQSENSDTSDAKAKPTQRATATKRKTKNEFIDDTKVGILDLSSGSEEEETTDKSIASNQDALEYLEPLQIFASERAEHSPIIGLLAQLQAIFENRSET